MKLFTKILIPIIIPVLSYAVPPGKLPQICAKGDSLFTVGLVLSGGGAKGLSHIGVIQALEENGIPIDYICGTSMGAVVGSMYAIGMSPGEMLNLVKSDDFKAWCSGKHEDDYAGYFYREESTPRMFSVQLHNRKGKLGVSLPSSLVSPYPLDLAMMEVYASPTVACNYNFNELMVPFFCISANVRDKVKVVHTGGDLGSAVRASMTYPFVFKPITIDSMVLFDGGVYDNFPWEELERLHSPSFIIGSKCVVGDVPLDDENIVAHITNMIVSRSNFDIPPDKGIVIEDSYPFGVMEFDKIDEIVEIGYRAALARIPHIRKRIGSIRTQDELDMMRYGFRNRTGKMYFSPHVEFDGSLDERQKMFVSNTLKDRYEEPFDFSRLKSGYYKVAATGAVKTFYPSYRQGDDSLLVLRIRASAASPLKIYLGGNISSSSLNQGYIGASYMGFGKTPWKLHGDFSLGRYYTGGSIYWRHNVGIRPLFYYDLEVVGHRFRYPNGPAQREVYMKGGAATPLWGDMNLLLKGSAAVGWGKVTDAEFAYFSPSVAVERNTLNYPMYPTDGSRVHIGARWNFIRERWPHAGTGKVVGIRRAGAFALRAAANSYVRLNRYLVMGYNIDVAFAQNMNLYGYFSNLLHMPAFAPFPHARTMMLAAYRANKYAGIGISPVICATKSLFLHCNISYFQPYRQITALPFGGYAWGKRWPSGHFLGNAALVWQSPAGPVAVSASYYQRGERHKWYFQLNIGYLLFKKRIFEDWH